MPSTRAVLALAAFVLPLATAEAQDAPDFRAILERQMTLFALGPGRGVQIVPLEEAEADAVTIRSPEAPDGYALLAAEDQLNLRVSFAFDSAAIAETEKPTLRAICAAVDDLGVRQFRIIGHTDATGDAAYNQRLSERRAEEVRRFFMADCGIGAERLEAVGLGKRFPANAADPFADENRRVEFQAMG